MNRQRHKISVVMPVYNTKEEYLREAIESILNQTFTDFEFIILNDGSTNNAEEVILSYKDERIKYFKHENMGVAATLNRGLELAQGEYIARMDSDDISLPERFQKQVDFLDNNHDYSIISAWYKTIPDGDIRKFPEHVGFLDLLNENLISHPLVMIRKADFEKFNLKYDSSYKSEDYELWSRVIRYSKIYNMQEVLLKYRMDGQNISSAKDAFIESDKKIKRNMLDFLTNDEKVREMIMKYPPNGKKENFLSKIFSIKNSTNREYKIFKILGFKFFIKRK